MAERTPALVSVAEAGRELGVSLSTVWRLIRRGALPSVRRGGRRWVPERALRSQLARPQGKVPPLGPEHPIFRLAGAGRSGGRGPGARAKHAILDR
jgi:excisionase family DNA binding protein